MNLMCASSCPLSLLFYDGDIACQILSLLHNFSDIKFVPPSETILLDSLYSEKIIMHVEPKIFS